VNQQICQIYRKSIDLFVFLQADNRTKHTHMHTKYWFYCSNQQNNLNLKKNKEEEKTKEKRKINCDNVSAFIQENLFTHQLRQRKTKKKDRI